MKDEDYGVTLHTVGNNVNLLCISKSSNIPLAHHVYFTGSEQSCKDWCNKRKHLVNIMRAWECGKQITFESSNGYFWDIEGEPGWEPDCYYKVKSSIDDIVKQSKLNLSDEHCEHVASAYDSCSLGLIMAIIMIVVGGIISSIGVIYTCNR